jgi:UDP-3-O-[3-hydroxymyristoyl] glucosamine N-acyltransferase
MSWTLAELAQQVGGRVEGQSAAEIRSVAGLREAQTGDLSFLASPKYARLMATTRATAVLVPEGWQGTTPAVVVRVADPSAAFTQVVMRMARPPVTFAPGVHPSAVVAPTAVLGRDVTVGPFCVLEPGASIGDRTVLVAGCYVGHETVLGADCTIYPWVSIRERVRIGNRAILHSGVVIGSDGFGYERVDKHWRKIPQVGTVVIGDDVELGANTAVDRARFGETRVGNGTKIDNLVQVAHNCVIGEDTAIAGLAGLSGSTVIGSRVQVGGGAGFSGHLEVGDDAAVVARAGVVKDVPAGMTVSGYMAVPHEESARIVMGTLRLPELLRRVAALERQVKELSERS